MVHALMYRSGIDPRTYQTKPSDSLTAREPILNYVSRPHFMPPPVSPERAAELESLALRVAFMVGPATSANELDWRLSDAIFSDEFRLFIRGGGQVWTGDTLAGPAADLFRIVTSLAFYNTHLVTEAAKRGEVNLADDGADQSLENLQEWLYGEDEPRELQEIHYGNMVAHASLLTLALTKPKLGTLLEEAAISGFRGFAAYTLGMTALLGGGRPQHPLLVGVEPLDVLAIMAAHDESRDELRDQVDRLARMDPSDDEARA
jgi:hypothetical protein